MSVSEESGFDAEQRTLDEQREDSRSCLLLRRADGGGVEVEHDKLGTRFFLADGDPESTSATTTPTSSAMQEEVS